MKPINKEKPDRWLTAAEVGERLSCSEDCVWKAEGALAELTRIQFSKSAIRYSENELLEWMAAQFQKAKEAQEQRSKPANLNNVVELKPKARQRNLKREHGLRLIAQLRKEE